MCECITFLKPQKYTSEKNWTDHQKAKLFLDLITLFFAHCNILLKITLYLNILVWLTFQLDVVTSCGADWLINLWCIFIFSFFPSQGATVAPKTGALQWTHAAAASVSFSSALLKIMNLSMQKMQHLNGPLVNREPTLQWRWKLQTNKIKNT